MSICCNTASRSVASVLLGLALFCGTVRAETQVPPQAPVNTMVDVAVFNIFAPVGFDDNDNVEFVISGSLPDTCYKIDEVQVEVGLDQIIRLTQRSRHFDDPNCLKMYVPFSSVIHVGILQAGDYVIVDTAGGLSQKLHIDQALHATIVDENLYAPVDTATFNQVGISTSELVIQGWFTNTCVSLSAADVKVMKHDNVIEALPVMEMRQDADCLPTHVPFTVRVALPQLSDGPYLAHVRSLNGRAVNTLFYMLNE